MSFSEKVIRIRKQAIMSQSDFAKALGVSLPSVCRWEAGRYEASYSAQRKLKEFCEKSGISFEEER